MRINRSKKEIITINAVCFMVITVSIFAIFIRFFDKKISPAAMDISINQVKQETTTIINNSINEYINEEDMKYSGLVSILYDESGDITSIETMSQKVNRIQSELAVNINNDINNKLESVIDVPLGSVSGMYIFFGKGPNIKVKIIPIGNVKTQLKSEFSSAGINQTKHSLIIDISTEVVAILPFESKNITINTSYMLTETIIVGKVPENYLGVSNINKDGLMEQAF